MFIEDNSDDVNAVDKEEIHRSLYRLKVAFLTQRSFLQFLSVANILPGVKKSTNITTVGLPRHTDHDMARLGIHLQ